MPIGEGAVLRAAFPRATPARAARSSTGSQARGNMELDRKLFATLVVVLTGFGLLMVHSASFTSRPGNAEQAYLSRHLVFIALGATAAAAAAMTPARFWRALAPWLFVGSVLLLVLVLIPGIGATVNGARRWFRLGTLSFQPSELAKLALPLFMAASLEKRQPRLRHWWHGTLPLVLPVAVVVPMVLVEPDLGTALFLACGAAIMLFVGGWPLRNFAIFTSLAAPAVLATVLQRSYQVERIEGFLRTLADWNQAPYHMKQSLVTLGAGGLWGTGLGRGYQKLSFLPEANTDFVFAVIGEELGLPGTICVLLLWLGVYATGLRLILRLPRGSFEYMAAFTLLTQLMVQVAINVAVVTAVVPPKGIPHPLLSYGGSNLVVSLAATGIVLGLSRPQRAAELTALHPALAASAGGVPEAG
jgi:cell division protein FtsW